jgi:small conductance mechanosensitive channel
MMAVAAAVLAAQSGTEEVLPRGLEAEDWIRAGIIVLVALVAARILQALIERGATRADIDRPLVPLLARSVRNAVIFGGLLTAVAALDVQLGPLLGALGIGGLAVAFAAKTILENLFASILLRTRRPIRRGDQISTLDCDGTVEDINLRVVVLRTYDGERLFLPCLEVLGHPIVNHTVNGVRRTTLRVGVAYDTDLDRAAGVLEAAVRQADGVLDDPPVEVRVEQFGESSIDFALRYWHAPDNASLWRVRSDVARSVKRRLDEAGITIPFPQRTVGFLDPEVTRGLSRPLR